MLLIAAFVAASVPVCPCAVGASDRGEHACCAPPLSLRGQDDDCCAPSVTLEGVAGEPFAVVAPSGAPSFAALPALPSGVREPVRAVACAPSPPSILRI